MTPLTPEEVMAAARAAFPDRYCPTCHGTGTWSMHGAGSLRRVDVTCPSCGGTGHRSTAILRLAPPDHADP